MTTATDNNETKQPDTEGTQSTENTSGCGPECECGKPTSQSNTKLKIAVCLVVVVAIAGILLFKILNSRQQQSGSCASLAAIAALNTVAGKTDTVFLVIPDKDNTPVTKETSVALASVERTLNAKGINTGIFTLKTTSPDYQDIAAKITPPGIAVLTKGRSVGLVSGSISETSLMQAYVASTRGGGCGPGGCPPPNGGKATIPCN